MSASSSSGSPAPTVAVVGATGLVGETVLRVFEERGFPVGELRALGSARSAGTRVHFRGKEHAVEEATTERLRGADFVFFAATGELSRSMAPAAAAAGAVVIDKSSTWRMAAHVPLVVPEINPGALAPFGRTGGIVSCPNCTTIGLVMALEPLRRAAGLAHVTVTTLQAASGAGREGLDELRGQRSALFPRALAGNVIPQCERFQESGYTTEEQKLSDETRKILALPALPVTMTCVRVPVAVGHSAAVLVETEHPLSPEEALDALRAFPGLSVGSANEYTTPLELAGRDDVHRDDVHVGRVRRDPTHPRRLWLWTVVDNIRKGAATNAVQIAEELLARR
ncbi:MAG: aspartate-semialdehyde dehydrogenase [Planctomycetes bacterium]|nr:aspartate-semialdehyde dehydrogenase [Planctomycetota bacterium]